MALKVTGDPVNPVTVAVNVLTPPEEPKVALVVAIPLASVMLLEDPTETPVPPAVAAQLTVVPATAFPPESVILTASCWTSWVPATPTWLLPELTATALASPLKTVIPDCEPLMDVLTVSVPVMLCKPALFSVALKVFDPDCKVEFTGRIACGSLLEKCTVPEYPTVKFPKASLA